MTRKFSKSLLTKPQTLAWAAMFVLMLGAATAPGTSRAQQAIPAKEKQSYIRCWNMLPVSSTNNLMVFAGENSMFGAAPFDLYSDYFVSPVGSYNLVIKRGGEKQEPLQKIPVALRSGAYITLLATERDGRVSVQLIDDTPDPNVKELSASLVVRSFFAGGKVTVGVTGGQQPQPIPDNATVTLDNLPMTAAVNVTVQVAMPTQPTTKRWDLTADFSVARHATLLLSPDRYGRLKPRLVYNGYVAHPEAQQARDNERR